MIGANVSGWLPDGKVYDWRGMAVDPNFNNYRALGIFPGDNDWAGHYLRQMGWQPGMTSATLPEGWLGSSVYNQGGPTWNQGLVDALVQQYSQATDPNRQAAQRAYVEGTMGGGYYGGVIPEELRKPSPVGNPWGTLNNMGIYNPATQQQDTSFLGGKTPWMDPWAGPQPDTGAGFFGQRPHFGKWYGQDAWGKNTSGSTPFSQGWGLGYG